MGKKIPETDFGGTIKRLSGEKDHFEKETHDLIDTLREAEKATEASAKAVADAKKLRQKVRDIRSNVIQKEFSGKHPRFTYRQTGRPVPCCPACQGLNPNEFAGDKDAGHTQGCVINALKKLLTKLD